MQLNDLLQKINKVAQEHVIEHAYTDGDSDAVCRVVSHIIDKTDTPFLDDTTCDPFMKVLVPMLVREAVQEAQGALRNDNGKEQRRFCFNCGRL